MIEKKKKFIGCIVGTGVGDALGEPVEGCTRIYIENYNVDIPKLYLGRYTDDTQLTIAIAESLIRAKGYDPNVLSKRFIEWLDEPPIGPGRGCLTSIHGLKNGRLKVCARACGIYLDMHGKQFKNKKLDPWRKSHSKSYNKN